MAVRKLKPIEERDPYAALVLAAFDALENPRKLKATPESSTTVQARAFRKCVMQPCENCLDAQHDSMDILNFGVQA